MKRDFIKRLTQPRDSCAPKNPAIRGKAKCFYFAPDLQVLLRQKTAISGDFFASFFVRTKNEGDITLHQNHKICLAK